MNRTRAIGLMIVVVCVGGVAGMIVTSITNHNGAAITFGLVTAVAVLCQLVATTVGNELRAGTSSQVEHSAARLEEAICDLVGSGADESAVRDLVRHAVRLGRSAATGNDRSSAGPDLPALTSPAGLADHTGDGQHDDDEPGCRSPDRGR